MNVVAEQLQLRAQAVSAVLVVLLLLVVGRVWLRRRNQPVAVLNDFLVNGGIAAIVAGRIAWVTFTAPRLALNPFDLIRVQSGVDLATAALAFVLVSTSWHRRKGSALPELGAVVVLLAPAIYAGLCLFRGDCYGRVAVSP